MVVCKTQVCKPLVYNSNLLLLHWILSAPPPTPTRTIITPPQKHVNQMPMPQTNAPTPNAMVSAAPMNQPQPVDAMNNAIRPNMPVGGMGGNMMTPNNPPRLVPSTNASYPTGMQNAGMMPAQNNPNMMNPLSNDCAMIMQRQNPIAQMDSMGIMPSMLQQPSMMGPNPAKCSKIDK